MILVLGTCCQVQEGKVFNLKSDGSYMCHVPRRSKDLPGKPAACYYGLASIDFRLFWALVARYFGLIGFPGMYQTGWISEIRALDRSSKAAGIPG